MAECGIGVQPWGQLICQLTRITQHAEKLVHLLSYSSTDVCYSFGGEWSTGQVTQIPSSRRSQHMRKHLDAYFFFTFTNISQSYEDEIMELIECVMHFFQLRGRRF